MSNPSQKSRNALTSFLYNNSLTLIFVLLFLATLIGQIYTGLKEHDDFLEQKGGNTAGMSKFWFEAFQNYQSEFISVAAIIFLTVYLRQHGSAQSKAVDAPDDENE